ncbi:hypothetical protein CVT24_000029 [Panaeolus cyanescens]|uniref:F-box domain-containing protein n=1 Tax=Panaeolus cyanescens TaxID=181874 RepID=A0A409VSC9_9AGAR|nr:hypothetical protein CVT24_000029 [Panaeolus cyanescens]
MLSLQTLPSELIVEIATHLEYTEAQNLRLVCRCIEQSVRHIALSRLKISFPKKYGPHYNSDIVFDKINAYTNPGLTPGFQYVRHLTVDRICVDLARFEPSLNDKNFDSRSLDQGKGSFKTQKKLLQLKTLFRELLFSNALKNLETVTWHVRKCPFHIQDDMDPERKDCYDILDMFAKLLAARGPLRRLEILIEEGSALKYNCPGIQCIPECKELVIEGVDDMPLDLDDEEYPNYQWVHKLICDSSSSEVIDVDWRFDEARFDIHFPPSKTSDRSHIRYLTLCVQPAAYQISRRLINHFRFIQKLDIGEPLPNDNDFPACVASLWSLLSTERIYPEGVRVHLAVVQPSMVDYLASYPRNVLKDLYLWAYDDERVQCAPGVVQDFYARAFPVIAPSLEAFYVDTYHLNEWCFKPETFLQLKKCVSAIYIRVSMSREHTSDSTGAFKDMIYSTFTRHHRQLKTVEIIDIGDDYAARRIRYEQYELEFAGPCLKVMWGGVCNLHRAHLK